MSLIIYRQHLHFSNCVSFHVAFLSLQLKTWKPNLTKTSSPDFFLRYIFSCGHATLKEALSVHWSVTLELKMRKTRVYDTAVFIVCAYECVFVLLKLLGWGWGLEAPPLPSATILWPRVTWSSLFCFCLSGASSRIWSAVKLIRRLFILPLPFTRLNR